MSTQQTPTTTTTAAAAAAGSSFFAFVEGEFLHAIGPGLEPLHVPDEVQEFERTGLGEASDAPVLVGIAPSVVVLESEGGAASVDELGE